MKKTILLILMIITSLFTGCGSDQKPSVHFYTWKTNPDLGQKEHQLLKATEAKRLFVRLFDITMENGLPQPRAQLKNLSADSLETSFTPVVFITNETFQYLGPDDNKQLANNVTELIDQLAQKNKITYDEIQIDCDWTSSTKADFFSFLKNLKETSNKEISSTLRLHQVKYREQTGIPPVKKVYLMAYATSSPIEDEGVNSILDMKLLQNYLQNINDYPLEFDIALPLYSWGIVSNHLGKKKLINGISEADLHKEDFTKIEDNKYEVKRDLFLNGIYINKGFTLKIEHISPELLKETKTYLRRKIKTPYDLVYYHLDHQFTDRFQLDDLL